MLTFNQIPIDIRTPGQYVEFDNSKAIQGLPAFPHKILVIGQRLTTGTVAANVPTRVFSADQGDNNFGRGSMLANMLRPLKNANPRTECWAIALDDDASGVKAAGSIKFVGAPTEAGSIYFYLGGVRVTIAVAAAASLASMATAMAAAINAKLDLPVTAVVNGSDTAKVDITFRHKGVVGNNYDLRVNYGFNERLPAGITTTLVAMTGGTVNPDLTATLAAIAGAWYNTVVCAYIDSTNLGLLEAELEARWGPMVQLEGHAFVGASGTQGQLSTIGSARNSEQLTIFGAGKSPTPPWICAAIVGAIDAAEPDPARPRQTLLLPGILAPAEVDRLDRDERDALLNDGISTFLVDAGGNVMIERLITTYETNAFGLPDVSYLDIETMRTLAYLRYSLRARIASRFPRYKLADDGTQLAQGQNVVTPLLIRAEIVHLFDEWMDAGLAEGKEQFKQDLIVERNTTDVNRVDAIIPPDVINQFRVFAAQIQFRL